MNPRAAGQVGEAISGAADQLGSAADYAMSVADRIKKAQDEGILLDATNKIDADIQTADKGLNTWTDYTNADQLKQQTADTLREKYAEQYGNRPELWRHIEGYLGKELNGYGARVDVKSAHLTEQFNQAALTVSNRNVVDRAAVAPTVDEMEYELAIGDGNINLMVQNGSISPVEGEKAKTLSRSQTIETRVRNAANPLNSPEVMQSEMDKLKQMEGKGYVEPEKLAEYQRYLGEALKVAKNHSSEVDVSQKGDAWMAKALNDPTIKDPETGNPDFLKVSQKADDDPDLKTKDRKYIRDEMEQRDGVQKRVIAERDAKSWNDIESQIYDPQKPLTSAEVKRRALLSPAEQGWIPPDVEKKALTTIAQVQRQNRVDNAPDRMFLRQQEAQKSAVIMNTLLGGGYLTDKSELSKYVMQGLSKSDADLVWSLKNAANSKDYNDAITMMNNSSLYQNDDAGNRHKADDLEKLRKTVEENKLTGPQILEAATQIMKPKVEAQKQKQIGNLLDNLFNSGSSGWSIGGPAGQGVTAPQTPTRPKSVPENFVWNAGARQWQLPRQ